MKNYASALLFGLLSLTSQLAHADLVDDAIGNIQQAINDAYNPSSASRRDEDDDRYEDRRRNDSRQYDDRRRQLEDRRRQLDDRQRQLDQDRRATEEFDVDAGDTAHDDTGCGAGKADEETERTNHGFISSY